jgi:hypothetical protein
MPSLAFSELLYKLARKLHVSADSSEEQALWFCSSYFFFLYGLIGLL